MLFRSGSDIGCGMIFVETNIDAQLLRSVQTGNGVLMQAIIGSVQRSVPVGRAHHNKMKSSKVIDEAMRNIDKYMKAPTLVPQIEDAYYQIGTLGGGNHFIEFQEDESGKVGIMIHTGSRHFGKQIGDHFNQIAKDLNQTWYSSVPESYNLAFLPAKSEEGRLYLEYMSIKHISTRFRFAGDLRNTPLCNLHAILLDEQQQTTRDPAHAAFKKTRTFDEIGRAHV